MTAPLRTLAVNSLLLLGWLGLHAPTLGWLATRWAATEGQLHLVLAMALLVAVARTLDPVAVLDRLSHPLHATPAAVVLAAVPPLAAAVVRHWVPVNALHGIAMIASAYGVVGLFVQAPTWRRWAGAAALAGAILPLTEHLDVFLGFPLRVVTAQTVAAVLSHPDVTSSTVLAVDGAFAHVDLPCSGVRSLWSGLVVLLGATVAWNRRVDLRFVGIALGTAAGLVLANIARVTILVLVQYRLDLPLLADILHLPMGVLGFASVMGMGLFVLSRSPSPRSVSVAAPASRPLPHWALAGVVALWVGSAVWPEPTPPAPVAHADVPLPADIVPLPHQPAEDAFAARHGSLLQKGRIERDTVRGTVVMVTSRSWLAHHVPTWCLQSAGWTLTEDHPARVGDTPVRRANAVRDGQTATALWWFESADDVTDDHTHRITRGLTDDAPWVLVSVLLDGSVDLHATDLTTLVDDLRASLRPSLEIL